MVCLIRHLTSVDRPINGFDVLPLPVETTPGPDLARIKWYRNKLAHYDSNTKDTDFFNTAWSDISQVSFIKISLTLYYELQMHTYLFKIFEMFDPTSIFVTLLSTIFNEQDIAIHIIICELFLS